MTESDRPDPKLPEEEEKVAVRLTKQIAIIFAVGFVLVAAAVIIELDLGTIISLVPALFCVAGLIGVSLLFCSRKLHVFQTIFITTALEIIALIAAAVFAARLRASTMEFYFPDGCPEETPGLEEVPDTRAKLCNQFYTLSTAAIALYSLGIIFHIALIVPTYKFMMIMKNALERRYEEEKNIQATQQPQGVPLQQMPIGAPQAQVWVQPQAAQQPQVWVQPLAQPQTAAPQQGIFHTPAPGGGQPAQPQALFYPVAAPYTNSNPTGTA